MPIPESYLTAILAGMLLHRFRPERLFAAALTGRLMGYPAVAAGLLLAAWAVSAAGKVNTANPEELVTEGPYAVTRNPMYVAWTLIGTGIGLAANTTWILVSLSAAVAFTHLIEIPREERDLERKFGAGYVRYRARVPRWL